MHKKIESLHARIESIYKRIDFVDKMMEVHNAVKIITYLELPAHIEFARAYQEVRDQTERKILLPSRLERFRDQCENYLMKFKHNWGITWYHEFEELYNEPMGFVQREVRPHVKERIYSNATETQRSLGAQIGEKEITVVRSPTPLSSVLLA